MRVIFLIICIVFTLHAKAQEKPLTVEEAQAYLQNTEHRDMTVYYETDELFELYARREPGEMIISGNEIYKVHQVKNAKVQSCNIVSIQTKGLTPEQHNALQKKVLDDYNSGTTFANLIEKYAEDEKWGAVDYEIVTEGTGFDEAIATHAPGEVFVVEYDGGFYVMQLNGMPVPRRAVWVLHATYKKP